ncbi:MAG TPA: hypothetical protein VE981_20985 [Planctomycetota bacterium]|nr:hypothetical protein [Planctomycetota bacterium]
MSFGPEPDPPLHAFFLRAETLAASALRTIPYVGDGIAEFFLNSIVPACTPARNRMLKTLFLRWHSLEGGLQVLLMRALPMPVEHGHRFSGVTARNGYGVPFPSPNGSASSTQK